MTLELLMRRGALVALLGAGLLAGCGQREEPPETIPPPIEPPTTAERAAPDAAHEDATPAAGQPPAADASAEEASAVTVTAEDDGRTLRLQKGQAVIIKLPADRAGGMTWIPAGNALPVIATDGVPGYAPDTGAGGAGPGLETWRFVANQSGQAELVFEYRSLQSGGAPLQTVVYRFDVE